MHAIGHMIKLNNKHLRLTYISTEKFTNEVINAIRYDKMLSFKERYRNNDALIDEIQFIAAKNVRGRVLSTFNSFDMHSRSSFPPIAPRESTLEEHLFRFECDQSPTFSPLTQKPKSRLLRKKRNAIMSPCRITLHSTSPAKSAQTSANSKASVRPLRTAR